MEQRNEMLQQMRLTARQKKGEVQHLLARSFSRKNINSPLSPPAEISFAVPQFPPSVAAHSSNANSNSSKPHVTHKAPSNSLTTTDKDTISIGELSTEPRVLGQELTVIAEGKPEEDDFLNLRASSLPRDSPPPLLSDPSGGDGLFNLRGSSPPPRGDGSKSSPPPRETPPPPRTRKDSSSSDSSAPEEQSVRTPLLDQQEGAAPTSLPVNQLPSIQRYDQMFASEEDGIPVGGAADNLTSQP